MNFAKNLQTYRKAQNLSQEELADRLGVSRQAISKWESGTGYPETEKLLELADLLDCNIDELLRGHADPTTPQHDLKPTYDRLMNNFSKYISLAIAIILFGTIPLLVMSDLGAPYANYGLVVFLFFVAISVPTFIIQSIKIGNFKQSHPTLDNFYTQPEIDAYNHKFSTIIASTVGCIMIGLVVFMAMMTSNNFPAESPIPVAAFMFFVTIGAPLFVYAGIQKGKYDIAHYNHENSVEVKTQSATIGKISGIIMMCATIIFMLLGFVFDLWEIAWIVYPISGIACGIVGIILQKNP